MPEKTILSLEFDERLPKDIAFCHVVIKAAEFFQIDPERFESALKYLLDRHQSEHPKEIFK